MPNPSIVGVTVTETVTAHSKTVQVQVSQDPIDLKDCGNGPVDIEWQINSVGGEQGWSFVQTDGIVVKKKKEDASPSVKFTRVGPVLNSQGRRFVVRRNANDADSTPTPYKYSIKVTDGTQTIVLDPSIINQP